MKVGELVVYSQKQNKKTSLNYVYLEFESWITSNGYYLLKLHRQKAEGSTEFIPVYQSETHTEKSKIFKWKSIKISSTSLLNDNPNSIFRIEIIVYDNEGRQIQIYEKEFAFNIFIDSKPTIPFGQNNENYIKTVSASLEERFSFMDYLFNGLNISMVLAIDFTGSNKPPNLPNSLHYYDPNKNPYMTTIRTIGGILESYDSDKLIPTFGFGAKISKNGGSTSHCFALNGNIFSPEIFSIRKVLEIYKENCPKLVLAGPLNLQPIISYVSEMINFSLKNGNINNYFIVLIMTDGDVHDLELTIDEVIKCSNLPISIIIIGIGDENFTNMEKLDADKIPLESKRFGKMKRDIIQFVSVNKYKDNPPLIAKETLEEVPNQIADYMKIANINPKNLKNIEVNTSANFYEERKKEFINSLSNNEMIKNIVNNVQKGIPTIENDFVSEYENKDYLNELLIN